MNNSPSTNSIQLAGNTRNSKPNTGVIPRNIKNQATSVTPRDVINPFKYEKKINTPKTISINNVYTPKVEDERNEELKVFFKTPITRSSSNNGLALRKIQKMGAGETKSKNLSEVNDLYGQNNKNNYKMQVNSARENSVNCNSSQRSLTEIKNEDNVCKTEGNMISNYTTIVYENQDNDLDSKEGVNAQNDFINRCLSQGIIYNPRAKLARSLAKELITSEELNRTNVEKKEDEYENNSLNINTRKNEIKNQIPSRNNITDTNAKIRSNPSIDFTKSIAFLGNNFNKSNALNKPNNVTQNHQFNRFLRNNSKSQFSSSTDNVERDNDSINSSDTTTINTKMTKNKNTTNNDNGNIIENSSFNYYVNIEDLMMLEEKLIVIMESIEKHDKFLANSCFDWWNFSNFCTIGGKFEFYFKDFTSKNIIRETNLVELISIILCYDLSFNGKYYELLKENLIVLLKFVHQNFLIICDYLMSKVSAESLENIWVQKISIIIDKKLRPSSKKGDNIISLKINNDNIKRLLRTIFELYNEGELIRNISPFIVDLQLLTIPKLNEIFRKKSLRIENKNASVPASVLLDEEDKIKPVEGQFVLSKPTKEYFLVLDLDETLIHFQISNTDENKGILSLRPGIYEFLNSMSKYYEMMIFTAGTHDYADPLIDAIERNKKYFAYRFYRQHTSIINNDFVKDISRIGRDLSKTIIVDNMPQNFRLQKENGIFIKTFYGDDTNDTALFELTPILKNIAESRIKDVRISLLKLKDEITKKVSSNISKTRI